MSGFVQVKNISFAYPGKPQVLSGISFEIERGKCLGVTGPSGTGKSTLAQIVAGHLTPRTGTVTVDGSDMTGRPQRLVFMIPQENDLFPWLTVEKQIAFAMKDPNAASIARWIGLTKLGGYEKYYPRELSGGMKKRLSIARALAVNPKLLIFDESFSALDIGMRREVFRDLKHIWQTTQTAVLLISHDPRDIQEIAEKEIRLTSTTRNDT